jgi:hypothetical protein
MDKVEVPEELEQLVEIIAFHSHESWAAGKAKQGYRHGDERDDKEFTHPDMLPYYILPSESQAYDRSSAADGIKSVLCAGYTIEKGEHNTGSNGFVVELQDEWDLDPIALAAQRRELDEQRNQFHLMIQSKEMRSLKKVQMGEPPVDFQVQVAHSKSKSHTLVPSMFTFDLIDPYGNNFMVWNLLIIFIVLYSCVVAPIRLAFDVVPQTGTLVLEVLFETVFIVDVVLQFHVMFFSSDGERVQDRVRIAKRYATSWFLTDAASSVPTETIELILGGGILSSNASVLKLLRLFKIFRLVKLMQIDLFRYSCHVV